MALVRKRKAVDYTIESDSDDDDGDTPNIKEEEAEESAALPAIATKRRRTYKRKPKIRVPSYNVWDTLPAEIKNDIYDLVLLPADPLDAAAEVFVGSHYRTTCSYRYNYTRAKKWRQPPLFLVSKTIREEAMSVYFHGNKFYISSRMTDVSKGIDWITRYVTPRSGDLQVSLARITISSWAPMRTMPNWLPIAKFIFEAKTVTFDKFLKGTLDMSEACEEETDDWCMTVCVGSAFEQVVKLTAKAKYRQVGSAWFEEDLKDWTSTVLGIVSHRRSWVS